MRELKILTTREQTGSCRGGEWGMGEIDEVGGSG